MDPASIGTAYRMGGDEFCLVAPIGAHDAEEIGRLGGQALRLADQRMYANKNGGASASRQSTDVLLQVLSERSTQLHEHLRDVAGLSMLTAQRLGLPAPEVARIRLAAELHDVGKSALPPTSSAPAMSASTATATGPPGGRRDPARREHHRRL